MKSFKFWCQKVLPLVYDDSLSYYELLCKVVDYLNNVIVDVNEFSNVLQELRSFVDNYFTDLNIQEQIDKKLDEMAESGILSDLLHNDFLDITFTKVGYSHTNIYYAIVPPMYKPKVKLVNDQLGFRDSAVNIANDVHATLLINCCRFDTNNGVVTGLFVNNGVFIKDTILAEDGTDILYYKDGILNTISSLTSIDVIREINPEWAMQGWFTIARDGEYVAGSHDPEGYQPSTAIAQDNSGNILIMVSDGRLPDEQGLSPKNIYDFLLSLNFIPRIAYYLDSGGSCAAIDHGIKVNKYIDQTDRHIPAAIYFGKDNVLNNNTFAVNKAMADVLRRASVTHNNIYANPLNVYAYDDTDRRFQIYSVDSNGKHNVYNRVLDIGLPKELNMFFIDTWDSDNNYHRAFRVTYNDEDKLNNVIINDKTLANIYNSAIETSFTIQELINKNATGFYVSNESPGSYRGGFLVLTGALGCAIGVNNNKQLWVRNHNDETFYTVPYCMDISQYTSNVPNGTLGYDNSTHKLYVRIGSTWYDTDGNPRI